MKSPTQRAGRSRTGSYKKLTPEQFESFATLVRLQKDSASRQLAYEVFVNGKSLPEARDSVPSITPQGAWNSVDRCKKALRDVELIAQVEIPYHSDASDPDSGQPSPLY